MGYVWYDWLGLFVFAAVLVGIGIYAYIADERDASEAVIWCPICEDNLPAVHEAHKPVA